MKQISARSVVLMLLCMFFIAGLVVFTVFFVKDGGEWGLSDYNKHINLSEAGTITDRDGKVLAQSKDGKREYSDDVLTRMATIHILGDNNGSISTGIQSVYKGNLAGFSRIFGAFNNGSNIKLTISSKVSVAALNAMGDNDGTVAVYNYKTGEVVCMVSTPTFDPLGNYDPTKDGLFLNKAISGLYTPGSTFKIITSAAALDTFDDAMTRTYNCSKGCDIDGEWVTCTANHGNCDLKYAFAESCNAYYAQLAVDLGADKLNEYAEKLGFNCKFTIDGIKAKTSHFKASKLSTIDLAWAGIGQYTDQLNPLQMLYTVGAIANGGTPVKPYMVESVINSLGFDENVRLVKNSDNMISTETASKLSDLMRYATTEHYGADSFGDLDVCSKTGTAERGDGTDNAVIVGFCRDEDLPLAFVVVVEKGGYGRQTALPVANKVLQEAKKVLTQKK